MNREKAILAYCAKENPTAEELNKMEKLIEDEGVDLNYPDKDGLTPLLLLCKKNRSHSLLTCLEILFKFEKPVDVDREDRDGLNCILLLCDRPNVSNLEVQVLKEVLELLLKKGANGKAVNKKAGRRQWNAVHLLCQHYRKEGLYQLIEVLFDQGHVDAWAQDVPFG